jgi:hypothetical protein
MSNTISAEEYRGMIGKKEPVSKTERTEPKTGKLTVEEAVRQVVLMLDLDEPQIKKAEYVINQLRLNGKL